MNYNTYLGNRKSLKFPVMCDGYVSINYNDNVANSPYGIWDCNDSFTIQSIITPYEINGNARGTNLTSQKTMPYNSSSTSQSNLYLPNTNRFGHKMTIFYNENVELFLQNTTTQNWSQPAEYRIGFRVKVTNDDTFFTDTIIVPSNTHYDMREVNDMYEGSRKIKRFVFTASANATTSGVSGIDLEIPVSSSSGLFATGINIYDDTNTLIGKIEAIDTTGTHELRIVAAGGYTHSTFNATSKKIFVEPLKEPIYVLNTHHIAASYNNSSGEMSVYYNGLDLGGKIHKDEGASDFNFSDTNIYLAQNPDATTPRYTQFMGEIHELSFSNDILVSFPSINTLYPQRRNLLLYLNFEEGELDD